MRLFKYNIGFVVCTVRTSISAAHCTVVQAAPFRGVDILCTHPMFGPQSGAVSWLGLPFVFERVRIRESTIPFADKVAASLGWRIRKQSAHVARSSPQQQELMHEMTIERVSPD